VLRRTKSDIPPEWAPGAAARIFAAMAVYTHVFAACWALLLLRMLLRGAGIELWQILVTFLIYALSLCFGYIGRYVLVSGIPFARLAWVVSFGLLAYSFGEYAFCSDAASPVWMFVLAVAFFLAGFGPVLRSVFVAKGQRQRGYDDGLDRHRSKRVLFFEMLAVALGVYSAFSWRSWIGF